MTEGVKNGNVNILLVSCFSRRGKIGCLTGFEKKDFILFNKQIKKHVFSVRRTEAKRKRIRSLNFYVSHGWKPRYQSKWRESFLSPYGVISFIYVYSIFNDVSAAYPPSFSLSWMFKYKIILFLREHPSASSIRETHVVMGIVLGNEHGDSSSNPGRNCLHFTLR